MTRTKSSRALVSVVLAVLMAVAFMPAISYTSFAATAKKATKVTKVYHKANTTYTRTVGSAWTLKYKLSPSKLTSAAKKVVWTSSNKSVVSVSAKSGNKAAVSFKKAGTATVTVYTKANKKAKATWKFKVVNKAATTSTLTGVTVSAPNVKDAVADKVAVGTTLKANVAPEDAAGVTYQWYADGTAIEGATKANYTVTTNEIGKAISVKAKSKNEVESAATAKVSAVKISGIQLLYGVKNATTGKLEYTGNDATQATENNGSTPATGFSSEKAIVGTTLKVQASGASDDDIANAATFKWYRLGKAANGNATTTEIAGATSDTYTLTKDDLGCKIQVVVTPKTGVSATGLSNGTWTKTTATAVQRGISVAINADSKDVSGKTVKLGTALTAAVSPADATVTYQWQQNTGSDQSPVWTNVATGASYTPTKAGTYRVVATLGSGETVYTGTPSATVTVSSATLDSVTIANTTATDANPGNKVGDSLEVQAVMAGNKNVASDNNVTYKWYRVANGTETEIKDQTTSTYSLTDDDVNATVYVKATYGGVTVKSNEITGIKNALTSDNLLLASSTDTKSAEVTVNNASADITWYEFAGTNAAGKKVLKKAATGTKFTPTIANANKVYYAVAEGTGNYAGKVMLAKTVSVDQDGNVTVADLTGTDATALTNYVFE